jgi:hypothetical protein
MRSADEIQHLAEKFWVDEAFVDEAALRSYNHAILKEVHKLCQAWDLEGIEDWLAVHRCAEPRCREEPFATAYEHYLMLMTISIAGTHAAMGSFNTMYTLAEQVLDLLSTGDERRAKLGLLMRPNSEIRYSICWMLAQTKWQDLAGERDRLMSVEDTASSFCRAADTALSWLAEHPRQDPSTVLETLALAGADIAAMLFRWFHEVDPVKVLEFIEWHNSRSGEQICAEVGHYLVHELSVNNAVYWTYELAKLYLTGSLTQDALDYCYTQRQATVLELLSKPRHMGGSYGYWQLQYQMMQASITNAAQ